MLKDLTKISIENSGKIEITVPIKVSSFDNLELKMAVNKDEKNGYGCISEILRIRPRRYMPCLAKR